jgi:hypothetical protein
MMRDDTEVEEIERLEQHGFDDDWQDHKKGPAAGRAFR